MKRFDDLMQAFTLAPILVHANPAKSFVIDAVASNFSLGLIISHTRDDRKLHPITFHSPQVEVAKIKYDIHDKELLAIADSFEQ